jgi:hypothetical protein
MVATIASATGPVVLHLRQVWAPLPELWVYYDVDGESIETPDASLFTATVGTHPARVEKISRFEDTLEGVSYVLLVDISRPLKLQFSQVQKALKQWVQSLKAEDRAAIMTFGEEVKVVQDFTGDTALPLPATNDGIHIRLTLVGKARMPRAFTTHLVDQVVIGRSQTECGVVISNDPDISACHCALTRERGLIFVHDLDSLSGTLVNGVPIVGRHKLQTDDVLLIGRTKLRFSLSDEAEK